MIMTHWASLIFNDCGYPRWPVPIMISQNFFMLALFGDFYRKAYLSKPKAIDTNGVSKKEIIAENNNKPIENNSNANHNDKNDNIFSSKIVQDSTLLKRHAPSAE